MRRGSVPDTTASGSGASGCVNDGALCDGRLKVEFDFAADARKPAQVRRENDANHGSVWTSTDSTVGRSRTIGDHVSPASADA
jgi:hypothetical protein